MSDKKEDPFSYEKERGNPPRPSPALNIYRIRAKSFQVGYGGSQWETVPKWIKINGYTYERRS